MAVDLKGAKVALLVTQGFEQVELTEPRERLRQAGAEPRIVSLKKDSVRAWNHSEWGDSFPVDDPIDGADPARFDALVLPGGVMNPDYLRLDHRAVDFARHFMEASKPVAAICHGPWLLIEAGVVRGRRLTSYPSLKTDLVNAGAHWTDEPVVVDGNLVTSRRPDDLEQFCHEMLRLFAAARQRKPSAAE